MNVLVQGKDLDVTQAIREFIDEQVNRKLSKVAHRIIQVNVYLEQIERKGNDPHRAKVRYKVAIAGSKPVFVRSRARDLYRAIVEATDDLVRQVRKLKEKRLEKGRQS